MPLALGITSERIIAALKSLLPSHLSQIGLHEPYFGGNEWRYLRDCLDSGWVSYRGQYVEEFEKRLSEFTQIKYGIALTNGTAALHLGLQAAGVTDGDEVLVPAMSFVAASNAIAYCRAIPHFVDSDEQTLGIDVPKLKSWLQDIAEIRTGACFHKRTGRRIKAVVAVHTFGHPLDLDPLLEVCQRFHIELIEDAAEALGSFYKEKHVGQWGKLAILSFNGNKTITTGGGGALLTNDPELGERIRHLSTTAKLSHSWSFIHDHIGYNYRLPNINAALGCAQLEQLPSFLEKKRALAARYEKAFDGISGIRFFKEPSFAKSNYWLNAFLLEEASMAQRDAILEAAHAQGLGLRPVWTLMHRLPMFAECPKMDLSSAEDLEARILNIPSSVFL